MTHSTGSVSRPATLPRSSGILLHVTSLPGPYGIGDAGPHAYRFADMLVETGQRIWQLLPLVPAGLGNSPYSSPSTFGLNPLFVSPALLAEDGLLEEPPEPVETRPDRVDFETVYDLKHDLLQRAFERFEQGRTSVDPAEFDAFRAAHAYWLEDFALFMALKAHHDGLEWTRWDAGYANREPSALEAFKAEHADRIRRHEFDQFVVFDQWGRLKRYCNERDVYFFGDLPIYVAHDSADVWAHRELFHLDDSGNSTVVAGVPPDYFSETGQRWGNPIYRWQSMQANGYAWWTRRIEASLRHADLIRLDHFRGFAGYWEIPAHEDTAVNGRWVEGPGASLFAAIRDRLGTLPLVAEDLGLITDDVRDLIRAFGFPGMAVLQFAFGDEADHPFLPHNHERNLVAYTGTHDNTTFRGWWEQIAREEGMERTRRFARAYLEGADDDVHWSAIRATTASPADYVVFPLQDVIGLGADARMNTPGESDGNWAWRFTWDQLTDGVRARLKEVTALHGRSPHLDAVL